MQVRIDAADVLNDPGKAAKVINAVMEGAGWGVMPTYRNSEKNGYRFITITDKGRDMAVERCPSCATMVIDPDGVWFELNGRNERPCPSCGVRKGENHREGCVVERCSVCWGHRHECACGGHDKGKSFWTGARSLE